MATAMGFPAVAGDLPAIRELILHDHTGLLIRPDSPSQLADTLRMLRDDPLHGAALARAGQDRVRDEFSFQMNISRLERSLLRVHADEQT